MALFTNAERKNGYSSSSYKLPELTPFEKKARRIELLLLENPAGFYKSHLKTFVGALNDQEIESVLDKLHAKELDGFWIHPHYFYNIRYNGATYVPVFSEEEASLNRIINAINQDPLIPIYQLMRLCRFYSPNDLVTALLSQTQYEVHKENQYIASCYLLRHFNIRNIVHKL